MFSGAAFSNNLSEGISEYQEPSEQRRHRGRGRSNSQEGALDGIVKSEKIGTAGAREE